MKIQNHSIQPNSANRLERNRSIRRQKPAWTDNSQGGAQLVSSSCNVEVNQWGAGYSALMTDNGTVGKDQADQGAKIETNLRLIEVLVYQMLGRRIKLQVKQPDVFGQETQFAQTVNAVQERDGWGLVYEYQEAAAEQDSMQFNSGGTVTTSDGRTLAFSLEFSMSRAYYEQNSMDVQLGDAEADPFMAMMENRLQSLSNKKAVNGEGYMELYAYDLDYNGWIDETDDVCGRLSMLLMSEKGDKTLVRLADVGIGAIYLQEVDMPYEAGDAADTYGDIKNGSPYLKDNGRTGIHHIDLKL